MSSSSVNVLRNISAQSPQPLEATGFFMSVLRLLLDQLDLFGQKRELILVQLESQIKIKIN